MFPDALVSGSTIPLRIDYEERDHGQRPPIKQHDIILHRRPRRPSPGRQHSAGRRSDPPSACRKRGVPGAPTPDHETRLARRSPADRLPPRLGRPSFLRRFSRDRRKRPTSNEKNGGEPGANPECEHCSDWVAVGAVSSEPVSPARTHGLLVPSTIRPPRIIRSNDCASCATSGETRSASAASAHKPRVPSAPLLGQLV